MAERRKRAVLIAGPTASGKSALALALAREIGGIVVNTDAMQVYDGLRVITARPSPSETEAAPHRLYGIAAPGQRFSTGAWLSAVARLIDTVDGTPLIFVGGTGLYFDALRHGFADVPAVPPEIVAAVERELHGLDAEARGRVLAQRDPLMAARLQAPDPQRVTRALAVLAATGESLARFQDSAQRGLLDGFSVRQMILDPGRDVLRARIAERFTAMFAGGAVAEVESLLALDLDPRLPAMKAIGVREIGGWLKGAFPRQRAIDLGIIATQQYAKRQRTWFRSRMADWVQVDASVGLASVLEFVAELPQS